MFAHPTVHGAEGVVQQVDLGVTVHGTSQRHAHLLAATEVDALHTGSKVVIRELLDSSGFYTYLSLLKQQ